MIFCWGRSFGFAFKELLDGSVNRIMIMEMMMMMMVMMMMMMMVMMMMMMMMMVVLQAKMSAQNS